MTRRSAIALDAANFFQAEMIGVVLPVLNVFLKKAGWQYDALGVATAAAGLGTLLFQGFAGWLTDRVTERRWMFAAAAILTGACFVAIPFMRRDPFPVDSLLFVSGAAQSFFGPLLGALALGLAGHRMLTRTMGENQGWNHAGNIFAAVSAMGLVSIFGLPSVFLSVGVCSLFAAVSALAIRESDLNESAATGLAEKQSDPVRWTTLLRDRNVLFLLLAVFAFHLANAPILPTVALYVKQLGGSDNQMTATVLTAQIVMVPVALLAAKLCDCWGRKPTLAVAFLVLPARIVSYNFVATPKAVVYLQGLDGIGAGIYGVAIVAIAADLTRGKGRFNTLTGLFATALAIGGVAGPLLSGVLVQHLGFHATFLSFAALAALGAAVFLRFVPETGSAN